MVRQSGKEWISEPVLYPAGVSVAQLDEQEQEQVCRWKPRAPAHLKATQGEKHTRDRHSHVGEREQEL